MSEEVKTEVKQEETKEVSKKSLLIKQYAKVAVMVILMLGAWVVGKVDWNPTNIDKNCKIVEVATQTTAMTALLSDAVYKQSGITQKEAVEIAEQIVAGFDAAIVQIEANKVNTNELKSIVTTTANKKFVNNPTATQISDLVINSLFVSFDNVASKQKLDNEAYLKLIKSIRLGLIQAINSVKYSM